MSHILDKCHVFNFSESYAYADKVRKAIFEDKYVIDPVEIASNIDDQIVKPQQWTILHDYIKYVIEEDFALYFRGAGWDYSDIEPVFSILNSHGINYLCLSRYIEEQHRDNNTGVTVQVTEDLEQQHKFDYVDGITTDDAMLHWTGIAGADQYRLILWNTATGLINKKGVNSTSYALVDNLTPTSSSPIRPSVVQ